MRRIKKIYYCNAEYVFDTEASEYLILDKPSAVIIESFENIESMLDSILDEVLS